jgi:transposase-like protein
MTVTTEQGGEEGDMPMGPLTATATPEVPSVEVRVKATRRRFTKAYKKRIVKKAKALEGTKGAVGELLRGEGLYTSHLSAWRRELAAAAAGARRNRPGRPAKHDSRRLLRENARLKKRLALAEGIIEVQRKLCRLFGLPIADGEPQK